MLYWEPIMWDTTLFANPLVIPQFPYYRFLLLGYSIFIIGFSGFYVRRGSIIHLLICAELILLGINLIFLMIGILTENFDLYIVVMMLLVFAAAETAIALSLLSILYKVYGDTEIQFLQKLHF